ncbi:MAG: endonuclease/exonuclease/phosphatase family protein [Anaerovorax sp.]
MNLKISTFNLKNDHWPLLKTHWSRRKPAVCAFFREENPDIIGTQELKYQRILELLKTFPEYGFIGEGRQGGQLGEYCAVFYKKTKFHCISQGTFWLSKCPHKKSRGWLAMFPRICTWATFSVLDGKLHETGEQISVFNTHLDHISPYARTDGLLQITEFINENFRNQGVILMGDFNAKPDSRALKVIDAMSEENGIFTGSSYRGFYSTASPNGKTYHGFHGSVVGKPMDYIFTSKEITIERVSVVQKKYCGMYPSDHFPIVLTCKK